MKLEISAPATKPVVEKKQFWTTKLLAHSNSTEIFQGQK